MSLFVLLKELLNDISLFIFDETLSHLLRSFVKRIVFTIYSIGNRSKQYLSFWSIVLIKMISIVLIYFQYFVSVYEQFI